MYTLQLYGINFELNDPNEITFVTNQILYSYPVTISTVNLRISDDRRSRFNKKIGKDALVKLRERDITTRNNLVDDRINVAITAYFMLKA